MQTSQERVSSLIDDLKDALPDPEICKSLDQCNLIFQKIIKNPKSPQYPELQKNLKNNFNTFLQNYKNIDDQSLFAQSCYSLQEIITQITTYLEIFSQKQSVPLRHTEQYLQTITNISNFLKKLTQSVNQRKANSKLYNSVSEFETNYFGTYVAHLTKTKADKSILSATSVSVGNLCTIIRNISECKNHQPEIDELNDLFNLENAFISISDLQQSIINIANSLNSIIPEANDEIQNKLKEQTQKLYQLTHKIILNDNQQQHLSSQIASSHDINSSSQPSETHQYQSSAQQNKQITNDNSNNINGNISSSYNVDDDSDIDPDDDDSDDDYKHMSKEDLITLVKSFQQNSIQNQTQNYNQPKQNLLKKRILSESDSSDSDINSSIDDDFQEIAPPAPLFHPKKPAEEFKPKKQKEVATPPPKKQKIPLQNNASKPANKTQPKQQKRSLSPGITKVPFNEYMKQDYKPPMKTVFNRYGELERDRNYPVPSKPKKKYDPYANTKSQYSQSELKKAYKPRQTYNNWN